MLIWRSITTTATEALPEPLSTVPFPRDQDYIPRVPLIDQINAKLSVPGARVALVGLGGVGKSQLAIDYAYQVRESSPSTWVLWIYASSAARFEQSVRKTLDDLKVPGRAEQAANVFRLLRNWLQDSRHGKWLLILDNVDDAQYLLEPPGISKQETDAAPKAPHQERILDYLPASSHGSILLTSRTTNAALKVVERKSVISVQPMGAYHAVELLKKKLDCEHTYEEALQLTQALDSMPLAINQAAAYISEKWPRCSVQQYLKKLDESDTSKLSLLNLDDGDLRRDREATNSIISTWQISFEHIRATRPSASGLLSLMSFCDRQSIPEIILRQREKSSWARADGLEFTAQDFERDVKMLRSYSLITVPAVDTFTMHSLVQFVTRKWLQARSEEVLWNGRFIYDLHAAFPENPQYEDWPTCAALYPHVKAAHSLKPAERDASETWACLLYDCGIYAWSKGLPVDARTMATLSVDELVRLEGQEGSLALRSMMLLANFTSRDPDRSSTAAGHIQAQVVAISGKIYGKDTAITANCKSLLAESYGFQGRWKEAEATMFDVIETLKCLLGEEHPDTLKSMNRLATMYLSQRLYSEALDLTAHVFEARERILGPKHSDTLKTMANLAAAYMELGHYEKAVALGTQAVENQREYFGDEHPSTLVSMANLARAFQLQHSYDKAIPLSTQALEMQRKVLGSEHTDTLVSMHSLACMYHQHGSYDKAIELGSEAYETKKTMLGPEHHSTLGTMNNLVHSLHAAGRQQSASDLMGLCAARSLDGLGPKDSEIVERQQLVQECGEELTNLIVDALRGSDSEARFELVIRGNAGDFDQSETMILPLDTSTCPAFLG